MSSVSITIPDANTLINLWETNDLVKSHIGKTIGHLKDYINTNKLTFTDAPIDMDKQIVSYLKGINGLNVCCRLSNDKYVFPLMHYEFVEKRDWKKFNFTDHCYTFEPVKTIRFVIKYNLSLEHFTQDDIVNIINWCPDHYLQNILNLGLSLDSLVPDRLNINAKLNIYKFTKNELFKTTANRLLNFLGLSISSILKRYNDIVEYDYKWTSPTNAIQHFLYKKTEKITGADLAYALYFSPKYSAYFIKNAYKTTSMEAFISMNSDWHQYVYDLVTKYELRLNDPMNGCGYENIIEYCENLNYHELVADLRKHYYPEIEMSIELKKCWTCSNIMDSSCIACPCKWNGGLLDFTVDIKFSVEKLNMTQRKMLLKQLQE